MTSRSALKIHKMVALYRNAFRSFFFFFYTLCLYSPLQQKENISMRKDL